jgi:2',3'-cyclic-nucleotide 2'-phosphodiesterase (5'-nucleotidase family)
MINRRLVTLFLLFVAANSVRAQDLVIFHHNDTHGRLLSAELVAGGPNGGAARLATLVKQERDKAPGRVLLLHAGDLLSRGDGLTNWSGGVANFEILRRLGTDALTPGNGDYYWGPDVLTALARDCGFAVLHANVRRKGEAGSLFAPWVMRKVNGIRVAILGLGVIYSDHPLAGGLVLDDAAATARRLVPELRERADFVILLSHLGEQADRALATAVPGIDLIVGGHSHSTFPEPLRIEGAPDQATPPARPTWITQAGDYGRFLGRVDVTFTTATADRGVARLTGRLLPVDSSVPPDAEIAAYLESQAAPLREALCRLDAALPNPARGRAPIGAFVAEAVRAGTSADLAVFDRGAAQAGLARGTVTLEHALMVHPWRNRVIVIEATGRELAPLLKQDLFWADGAVSGVGGTESIQLEPDHVYRVATSDFARIQIALAPGRAAEETGERVDTLLIEHLRKMGQ